MKYGFETLRNEIYKDKCTINHETSDEVLFN